MQAHIVSNFYLRGFKDSDPSSPGFDRVWVRTADNPAWAPQRTKKTARILDYYAWEGEVSKPNEGVEGMLGNIETLSGELFRKLAAAVPDMGDIEAASLGPDLSVRERIILAGFVVSTGLRVPAFHDSFQPRLPGIIRREFDALHTEFAQHPERLAAEIRQVQEETGLEIFRDLQPDDFRLDEDPEVTRAFVIRVALRKLFYPFIIALVNRTEWIFLVAKAPDVFITSDNPAAGVVTLLGPRPEVCFPLTRSIALLAQPEPSRLRTARWRPAKNRLVADINLRTAAVSKLWIASATSFPPTALSSHVIQRSQR